MPWKKNILDQLLEPGGRDSLTFDMLTIVLLIQILVFNTFSYVNTIHVNDRKVKFLTLLCHQK